MGRGYIRKQKSSRDDRKMYFRAEEYHGMDRPEICEVARRTIVMFRCGEIAVIRTLLKWIRS